MLGTAQLGSNYGITNSKQKVSKKESFKILDLAWEKGIRYFDTAPTYNSQKIIGEYIKVNKIEKEIKVFSKISSLNNNKNITKNIKLALEKNIYDLNVLPVINFIHDRKNISFFKKIYKYFKSEQTNLGISIYNPNEIVNKFKNVYYQFPSNFLDKGLKQIKLTKKL